MAADDDRWWRLISHVYDEVAPEDEWDERLVVYIYAVIHARVTARDN